MSETPGKPVAGDAAGSSSNATTRPAAAAASAASAAGASGTAPKSSPLADNPALRMMGLPRIRLPSRNWMIFWGITGSFASAVIYDKWQTRKMKEKWCKAVSHVAEETLDTKTLPRRLTIYLSAPPGDGLRSAREHFHEYIKPVLVAAAMDWDVVEGRKEGDVRYKTAERVRRKRKRNGEGLPVAPEDYSVELVRQNSGTVEYPGAAGDLVIGRHTWKEYIRGLHEGWLGPADAPPDPETADSESIAKDAVPVNAGLPEVSSTLAQSSSQIETAGTPQTPDLVATEVNGVSSPAADAEILRSEDENKTKEDEEAAKKKEEDEKKEEEKPKRRHPLPYIDPASYGSATASTTMPGTIGPSAAVRFPHLLGIRNTPIRVYRFLTRRRLADEVGGQVASAVLAHHRAYGVVPAGDDKSASAEAGLVPEQSQELAFEERDWWKTVHQPRQEHEESVLIEPMVFDERVVSRMRRFELSAEEGDNKEG